jgi:flagellar secretion chaperone FliS
MAEKDNAYLKTQVLTARPEQLTLMLFDGCIRFAEKARRHLTEKNYEGSFEALTRGEQIVLELLNGMRPEAAPEICRQQAGLYMFVYRQFVEANVTRRPEPLDNALRILAALRETWSLLMEQLAAQAPADRSGPPAHTAPALSVRG